MSLFLHQFHFLRPWWLLALTALPLMAWLGTRRSSAEVELSRLVDPELLPHLLRGRSVNQSLPVWLFALGWVLASLALAGPSWSRVNQPLYASRAAQVVALSLSQHMLARDVAPSRIDRARYKVRDLLASNHDGLNALIGYAGEAFVVAPLTSDSNSLDDLLNAMAPDTMPVDGDDAAAAIARGVGLIHDAKAGEGLLVLVTDQADAAAITQAAKAKAAGVHVSVLGVGTAPGGPVPLAGGGFLHDANGKMALAARDDASLRELAAAGGGRYVAMSAGQDDIDALHTQLRQASTVASNGQVGDAWQDRGPWLVVPLLLIVALAFRRGWLMLLPLVLLPLIWPRPAAATTWQDLWKRTDQQAAQALQNGHPEQALKLAHDPAWRGAAAYRAGNFDAAAQALDPLPGTDPAYNLGNTLAKQGKYQQAINAYDHALNQDPGNVDASANRKAVEDWLKQQKSQQKPSAKDGHKGRDGGKSQSKPGDGQGENKPSEAKKKDAGDDGEKSKNPSDQDKSKTANSSGQKSGQDDQTKNQPKPKTPQQQAEEKAKAEQAKQALKKQMDAALASKSSDKKPTHQLGAMPSDASKSNMPADLQHALQRVPDDPGALLRRKFELEYQQRHGGAPDQE
jgi:Ca-activated chloride channel family protein